MTSIGLTGVVTKHHFTVTITGTNGTDERFAAGAIPITEGPAAAPGGGGNAESDNLDSQQLTLTPLAINNTANTFRDIIFANNLHRLNGNGAPPSVNDNGFFVSAAGLGTWLQSRKLELAHKDGYALAVKDNGAVLGQQAVWNAWLKVQGTYYDGDGSSFDGYTLDALVGVDRKLNPDFLVGALIGYGHVNFDTLLGGVSGDFKADGFHVGGYGGAKLEPEMILDVLVAYTRSDYDNRSGATTGSFDADRITAIAQLAGTYDIGPVIIEPAVSFSFASEWQGRYTDSGGAIHAKRTVTAGRLSVGPRFIFPFEILATNFRPWLAGKAEYDFTNQGNVTSGLPNLGDVVSARISGGVDGTLEGGVGLSLRGDISGLGSGEYTAYGGKVKVSVPF